MKEVLITSATAKNLLKVISLPKPLKHNPLLGHSTRHHGELINPRPHLHRQDHPQSQQQHGQGKLKPQQRLKIAFLAPAVIVLRLFDDSQDL
jgi:hypothetical protein